MKITICLAATLMSLILAALPATAATKVFLLGGQSNMAGVGQYTGGYPWPGDPTRYVPPEPSIPSPYNAVQTAVKFWDGGWVNLQTGFGDASGEFGPEVTFGYTLHHTVFPGDNIYLVKYGVSSTSLAVNWNADGSGTTYNLFKSSVTAALNNLRNAGKNPIVAGMIWMQGESDTTRDAWAQDYDTNLPNFINKVRSDFSTPNMPFVVGRIDNYAWGSQADMDLVRTAQEGVAAVGNASWFNTDDLQRVYTGHYGTQGQVDLGIRFANAFVAPEPSTAALTALALLGTGFYLWRRRSGELPDDARRVE